MAAVFVIAASGCPLGGARQPPIDNDIINNVSNNDNNNYTINNANDNSNDNTNNNDNNSNNVDKTWFCVNGSF